MFRKPIVRWPLTALLLWLAWTGVRQAMDNLFSDEDWTDEYPRGTATIVDSRADYSSSAGSRGTWRCVLIVEWRHDGQVYRDEPIWLHGGTSFNGMADDCGRERFGEPVPVWIGGTDAAEPYLVEPGNRTAQPATGVVNALQALLFLGLVVLLWRPKRDRKGRAASADSG